VNEFYENFRKPAVGGCPKPGPGFRLFLGAKQK